METSRHISPSPALLRQVADGSETAFTQLVNDYAGVLYTVAFRYLDSKELAEELVQDIFTQVWLARESLKEIRNFRTYMYVLCRNHAVNALKKMLNERKQYKQWVATRPGPEETDPDKETGLSLIDEAIKTLTPQQRRAWEMSRKQARTYQEIAEELNVSRETVKTHIQRANETIIKYVTRHMDLWLLILLSKKIF